MSDSTSNNKRIAKNTLFLYFRTILIMMVSLYTSRVVLNTLGIEDFGVYNAVGGVVAMFAIISGALSNAISRFITYGIGQGDKDRLNIIFCTSVNIQILISIFVLILCECVGLWFLNFKMNIPVERMVPANWVLHCSLLTFVVNLISVPYNASIIAHEHMNAYAYISIVDALLKLTVAYMLIVSPIDKLIAYSVLLLVASIAVRLLYSYYCHRHFLESKYHFIYDKKLFKEMLGFAGWNFFTNGASILNTQGVSLLVNVYFGVALNSARGIATQAEGAIQQFVTNFTTAVNPQITKSYAQGDRQRMFYLICKGSKFAYLLMLLFSIPIMFEANYVLKLWLNIVPDHTSTFLILTFVGAMVTTLGNTGYTACMATGNIKSYAIWVTTVGSFVFFISWVAYYFGAPVEATYIIYIMVYIVVNIVRLYIMKRLLNFPIMMFVKEVLGKIALPTIASLIVPFIIVITLPMGIWRTLLTVLTSVLWTAACSFLLGFTRGERMIIMNKTSCMLNKIKSRI